MYMANSSEITDSSLTGKQCISCLLDQRSKGAKKYCITWSSYALPIKISQGSCFVVCGSGWCHQKLFGKFVVQKRKHHQKVDVNIAQQFLSSTNNFVV